MKKQQIEKLTNALLEKVEAVNESSVEGLDREQEAIEKLEARVKSQEQETRNTKEAIKRLRKRTKRQERENEKAVEKLTSGLEGLGINPEDYGLEKPKPKKQTSKRSVKTGKMKYFVDGEELTDAQGRPYDLARILYYNTSKGYHGSNKDGRLSVKDFEEELKREGKSQTEFTYVFSNGKMLAGEFTPEA